MKEQMYLIMGCTASGKSRLAFELAKRIGGEIISIDSMKVYKRMDIGTAKPSQQRLEQVPHHMIDIVEPWDYFGMGVFMDIAEPLIERLRREGKPIIAAGGTAMYIRALMEGIFEGPPTNPDLRAQLEDLAKTQGNLELHRQLAEVDPSAAERIHANDLKRLVRALEVFKLTGKPISSFQNQFRSGNMKYPWTLIGLAREKEAASRRMNARIKKMVEDGLVEEVRQLVDHPKGLSDQAAQAVGYAEIIKYFDGKWTLKEAIERIKINTRRFAKHQRTWYRGFANVSWINLSDDDTADAITDQVMKDFVNQ